MGWVHHHTGGASFGRLASGNWHLRVAGSGLPALHTIENPDRVLTIQPGENRQVALRGTLRLPDRGTIR